MDVALSITLPILPYLIAFALGGAFVLLVIGWETGVLPLVMRIVWCRLTGRS